MIHPLADRVAIRPLENRELTTATGLTIPDLHTDHAPLGHVAAVGKQVRACAPGDFVHYKAHAFVELTDDGQMYHIVRERDITAKQ